MCVPAAEPLVAAFRRAHLAESVERGLPPHITIVFPFVPAGEVEPGLDAEVARHFREHDRFGGRLVSVQAFPDHVWLEPEPRDRFARLIEATVARFPEYPPYGGDVGEIVPHLTIGRADGVTIGELLGSARAGLGGGLPLEFPVDAVSLLEEAPDRTWAETRRYPLA